GSFLACSAVVRFAPTTLSWMSRRDGRMVTSGRCRRRAFCIVETWLRGGSMLPISVRLKRLIGIGCVVALFALGIVVVLASRLAAKKPKHLADEEPVPLAYKRRYNVETSGLSALYDPRQPPYAAAFSLEEIAAAHQKHVSLYLAALDEIQEAKAQPI